MSQWDKFIRNTSLGFLGVLALGTIAFIGVFQMNRESGRLSSLHRKQLIEEAKAEGTRKYLAKKEAKRQKLIEEFKREQESSI